MKELSDNSLFILKNCVKKRKPAWLATVETINKVKHEMKFYNELRESVGDDVHASDTVQEKLPLAARFGESIFFAGPSKKKIQNIVIELAKRNGIVMLEEEILLVANKWELQHNGFSGRTAQQFIDALLSEGI